MQGRGTSDEGLKGNYGLLQGQGTWDKGLKVNWGCMFTGNSIIKVTELSRSALETFYRETN